MKYLIPLLLLSTSCATVVNSAEVTVPIVTDPPGAQVMITGEDFVGHYITPEDVRLPRGEGDLDVMITKPGFAEENLVLQESFDGMMMGNILMGVPGIVIGVPLDLATGNGYDLEPESIELQLQEVN